ncbi:hypothetical protein EG834_21965, partial [bacterium]|nr:hypothetical protein [bacterium]
MHTVGLVAAMPQESKALLKQVASWKPHKIGRFRAYRFEISQWDCWLIESGMGVVHAGDATRVLLKEVEPRLLVSFGIAGAVEAELQIGDVVAAEGTCILQGNKLTSVQPLALVSQQARKAVSAALKKEGGKLCLGTTITTRGSQLTGMRPGIPVHPVLEMETAGILQSAQEYGVPLVVLRAISDGPAAPIPFDIESMMDGDYNLRIGRILGAILRRPKILRQALQMSKNSEIAASNAAIAV